MAENLILEETEEGRFLVNGFEVSEETFTALAADLADAEVEDFEDCDDCGNCDFCDDVVSIVNIIKAEDEEDCFDILSDVLEEYYMMGRADALEDIAGVCDNELDEIYDELEDEEEIH